MSPARRSRISPLGLLLVVFWSCGLGPIAPDPRESADQSLLFIGNSLTYTNDLPGVLERLLENHGNAGDVYVESISLPNYGLQDHWEGLSRARQRIADGGWDVIVLQQGPSATEGRPSLIQYAGLLADEIESSGARPALYMVWPSEQRSFDFDGVLDSYRTAAEQANALFFPAGEAWRRAWARDPDLALYGPDGFHPSTQGTYLAAVVMFEQLSGVDPITLPASIPVIGGSQPVSQAVATALHEAAREANADLSRP